MVFKCEGVGDNMFSISFRRRNICEGVVSILRKKGVFLFGL